MGSSVYRNRQEERRENETKELLRKMTRLRTERKRVGKAIDILYEAGNVNVVGSINPDVHDQTNRGNGGPWRGTLLCQPSK